MLAHAFLALQRAQHGTGQADGAGAPTADIDQRG
jgi:hypothetical protein